MLPLEEQDFKMCTSLWKLLHERYLMEGRWLSSAMFECPGMEIILPVSRGLLLTFSIIFYHFALLHLWTKGYNLAHRICTHVIQPGKAWFQRGQVHKDGEVSGEKWHKATVLNLAKIATLCAYCCMASSSLHGFLNSLSDVQGCIPCKHPAALEFFFQILNRILRCLIQVWGQWALESWSLWFVKGTGEKLHPERGADLPGNLCYSEVHLDTDFHSLAAPVTIYSQTQPQEATQTQALSL